MANIWFTLLDGKLISRFMVHLEEIQNSKEDLSAYESGAGTLKFPLDKPMPYGLITKIVKFRSAESKKRTDKKKY